MILNVEIQDDSEYLNVLKLLNLIICSNFLTNNDILFLLLSTSQQLFYLNKSSLVLI